MLRLCTLCLLVALGAVLADEFEDAMKEIQGLNEGEVFNRNKAAINERQKKIDATFGGIGKYRKEDADMQAFNNRVKLGYGNSQSGHAGAGRGLAKADIGGTNQAAATGYGNTGGSAFANRNHGQMRLSKDSEGEEHADFTGQGRKKIETEVIRDDRKNMDRFVAQGEGLKSQIDPVVSNQESQTGGLFFENSARNKDEFWLYEVDNKNRNDVAAEITDQSQGGGSNADQSLLSKLLGQSNQKKYRCKAQKIGESVCFDQNGKTVGKTVATDDGNVVVYNNFNIPVARGKIKKESNNKYSAVVNEGLMEATTSDIKQYNCMSEFGKRETDAITLMDPITFKYNSQSTRDGAVTFQFPDCFEIGGRVKLGRGIDASRIATEFVVNVLPIGKLRCMDPGTCGRECYYCDYCQKKHKLDILDTTKGNVCSATGGDTVDMKVTICPPPETFNMALCSKFSKSLVEDDYWKKKGDIDVQMRFYLRPPNRDELVKQYQKETSGFLGAGTKLNLQAQWVAKYASKTGLVTPTDSELLEFYIQQKSQDELIGCERSILKYNLGGSKVDGTFLIESAALAGGLPSVFQQKPCKEWSALDQAQFDAEMAEAKAANSGGSSNPWSFLNPGRR